MLCVIVDIHFCMKSGAIMRLYKTYIRDIAGVIHDYVVKERLKIEQSTAAVGLFIMEEGTVDAPRSCFWNANQWPSSCRQRIIRCT